MLVFDHIHSAVQSLLSTRLRTLLTTTGIAIGVASVTSILALAGGVTNVVSSQITDLDGNIAVIRPGSPTADSLSTLTNPTVRQLQSATTLSETDLKTVEQTPGVTVSAPLMTVTGSIKADGGVQRDDTEHTIIATTPSLADVANIPVRDGQFIDESTNNNTAVIGNQLSIDLFGTNQPIGQTFSIRGQTFTVIGVLKPLHNPINYNVVDFDHAAIINLESGKSFNDGRAALYQINFRASSAEALSSVAASITKKLTTQHDDEQDFTVLEGSAIAEPNSAIFKAIATVMAIIAAISLIVGGVGVMNIMLVSVAERTREIGLRKSVGASDSDIVWQFMVEALIMSLLGGIIGYVAGYILAFAISTALPFTPSFSWGILGAAIAMAIIAGVVFGLYPAVKAARKDPIESLRHYH